MTKKPKTKPAPKPKLIRSSRTAFAVYRNGFRIRVHFWEVFGNQWRGLGLFKGQMWHLDTISNFIGYSSGRSGRDSVYT